MRKWDEREDAVLRRLKVREYEDDLRFWGEEEPRQEFSVTSSGRMMTARLIRNLVFQGATWAMDGRGEPVEGNLRSCFYAWIKPVLARFPELQRQSTDPYDVMLDEFETFIVREKLWSYRDLDLSDDRWDQRHLGDGRNPHVLLYVEKKGFMRTLKRASEKYGVNVVALGGSPSHLSTEYLCAAIRERWPDLGALVLVAITDHDPSGANIRGAFEAQLINNGFEISAHHNLITPEVFTTKELELLHYDVRGRVGGIARWVSEGGGINGQPWGIESDALPKSRLRELLDSVLALHLRP